MTELKSFRMLIDGAWSEASNGEMLDSINPATGKAWANFPAATTEDVDRAVQAAHRAMTEGPWSRMTATERGKALHRLGDLLAEHGEAIARVESRDTGKLLRETSGQIRYMAEYFRYFGGLADKVEGQVLPIDKPDMLTMTLREPIGVVAAIVPWNSALMLSAVKLGPALAAGNAVVLKASEQGPAALLSFAELFEKAGFPAGVVNVITGLGDPCGRALTTHPLVARIAFTGGPATARHVLRNAAENFAHVSLELGGKSPVLVFEDADLDSAANGIVAGIFGASGQSCVAGSRLIVQKAVADALIKRIAARAARIVIGDPLVAQTEMGPLATKAQLSHTETLVARSLEQGARLLCGGQRLPGDGWFFQPTILHCPDTSITAFQEEFFSPVLSVLVVEDEDEAIRAANDTRYGLAAGIFSRDGGRCLRVMRRLRSGIVWVNTYRVVSPMAPFGGFGDSGSAREGGLESILDYTRVKTVWFNYATQPIQDPFVMR